MSDLKLKAYRACAVDGDCSDVVFAQTAREAKTYAMSWAPSCEDVPYIDIRVKRLPLCDGLYKGSRLGDWGDYDLRKALVQEYGWCCIEPDGKECKECRLCDEWEDLS